MIEVILATILLLANFSIGEKSQDRPVVFSEDPQVFQGDDEHTVVVDIKPKDGVCWVTVDFILGETSVYHDTRSDMELLTLSIGGQAREFFPGIENETFTILEIEYLARKKCWPDV